MIPSFHLSLWPHSPNVEREIYQSWRVEMRVGCYHMQKSFYTQLMPAQLPLEAYFIFNMNLWWSKAGRIEISFFSFWFWHPIIFSKFFALALQNCFQKRRDPYQKSKVFVHFLPSAYRIFMKLFHGFMIFFFPKGKCFFFPRAHQQINKSDLKSEIVLKLFFALQRIKLKSVRKAFIFSRVKVPLTLSPQSFRFLLMTIFLTCFSERLIYVTWLLNLIKLL